MKEYVENVRGEVGIFPSPKAGIFRSPKTSIEEGGSPKPQEKSSNMGEI